MSDRRSHLALAALLCATLAPPAARAAPPEADAPAAGAEPRAADLTARPPAALGESPPPAPGPGPARKPLPPAAVLEEVSGTLGRVDREGHRIEVSTARGPVELSLDRNTLVYTARGLGTVLDLVPGAEIEAGRSATFVAYWVQVRAPGGAPPPAAPGTGPGGGSGAPAAESGGAPGGAPGGASGGTAPGGTSTAPGGTTPGGSVPPGGGR